MYQNKILFYQNFIGYNIINYLFIYYCLYYHSYYCLGRFGSSCPLSLHTIYNGRGFQLHYMNILCLDYKVYFSQTLFELAN